MNPNEIAAGDNPAKLTNAQVGAGYRLIETYLNPSKEDFGFHLDQREVTIPEVLTQRHGWRAVRWDEVIWALEEAIPGMPVKLDGTNILVALPFSFRVPLTPEFIAWRARQRPERINAAKQKDQRVRQARECIDLWTRELARAASDYDAARRRAFEATAAEYGYVPPSEKPKLEFPPLPAGAAWYNPAGLTPEEYGVSEGWRPFCTLDKVIGSFQYRGGPSDGPYLPTWENGGSSGMSPYHYYLSPPICNRPMRTKAPIPTR